jgi:hypothetical protein
VATFALFWVVSLLINNQGSITTEETTVERTRRLSNERFGKQMNTQDEQDERRLALEGRTRRMADEVKAKLKPGEGMTLFMFDLGEGGHIAYASTAIREDMIKAIREWLAHVED